MKKYDIDELLSRISLEDVLERYGWELKQKGRYIMVLCKFHHDTAFGSAMIYPDNPYCFMCFTCGKRYNIFDVYMYENNCDFAQALDGLAKEYGIVPQDDGKRVKRMPFSRKELAEIGLCMYDRKSEFYIEGFISDDMKDAKVKGNCIRTETFCENPYAIDPLEMEYSYIGKKSCSQMEHLHALFREDKETFKMLVMQKAQEAKERHMENYLFFQAISTVLSEKETVSNLTEALMILSRHGINTSQKILTTVKRL